MNNSVKLSMFSFLMLWQIATLLAATAALAMAAEQEVQPGNTSAQFPGTWELLSVERKDSDGNWVATSGGLSGSSIGMLMYDEFGNMSVHIMNPERAAYPSRGLSALTAEQLRETLRGYVAYFGTYEINERESYVVHHRQGHLSPNQVGVDAKRFFEFDRDRLTLYVAPSRNLRLTWRRVENQQLEN